MINFAISFNFHSCPIINPTISMLLLPNCKINLGLNVVSRREDGYHNIETVFYPIPLRDNLEFSVMADAPSEYNLTIHGMPVTGAAEDNLVVKVYLSLKKDFDLPPLDIFLYKKIPMGAGLGGGSSDAAFMMTGLNEVFDLGMGCNEMERRISAFGADCAFFIRNHPVFAQGIGDQMTPLPLSLKGRYIVLVKPDIFISTQEAYAHVAPRKPHYPLKSSILAPINLWRSTIVNDFELSVFPSHPELKAIKKTLYDMGAIYAAMSGSGSTIFGLFDRPAEEARKVFSKHFVFIQKLL